MQYRKVIEGILGKRIDGDLDRLAGDGSSRQFLRFVAGGENLVAVFPAELSEQELAESASSYHIAQHLVEKGIGVPSILGWDKKSGALVFEDLGDTRLQDIAFSENGKEVYKEVVDELASMNVRGGDEFDVSWCWDSSHYDKDLMLERESGYFLRAFWQDYLQERVPQGFHEETEELAERLSRVPSHYFLHRDFQSRNIMVKSGKPRIIDFQGGRRGPLGYDLASLLIDPYVQLDTDFQEQLFERYYRAVADEVVSHSAFQEQYRYLALQRNLQIIGAFTFLSEVKKKGFFADFIGPAILSFQQILETETFADFPNLRNIAAQSCTLYQYKRR